MKKIFYLNLVPLFIAVLFSEKSGAQTIVNITPYPGCDTNLIWVNISGPGPGDSLITYFGDGTSEIDAGDSSFGMVHYYTSAGFYSIKCVLLNPGGMHIDSLTITDTINICRTFTMYPYLDVNADCLYDFGDLPIPLPGTFEIDSAGVPVDTIVAAGFRYEASSAAPYGTRYAFKLLIPPSGTAVACPTGGVVYDTLGITRGGCVMGFNCTSSSSFDLGETVNVMGPGRHTTNAMVVIGNPFCTGHAGTLTMTFSPKYNFTSAWPAPTSVVGNVLTWDIADISYFASTYVNAQFDAPITAWLTPGDTIQSSYVLTPITGDLDPTNNTVIRVDTVKASYDPNEKSVMPQGAVAAGTNLDYKVVFENTGNGPAHNIHIQDTLSDDLDIHSIKFETATSQVFTTLSRDAAWHNVIKFDLPGIELPDSSHHGQCDGMVAFTINTKLGLPAGTVIYNRAGIYFDDNDVVMTDTAQTEISSTTGVVTMTNAPKAEVYPNPVNDELTIKTANGDFTSFTIVNTIGQLMMTGQLDGSSPTHVDVRAFPAGVYYITLKGGQGKKVVKFEKMD